MKKIFMPVAAIILGVSGAFSSGRDPERGYRGFADWENLVFPDMGFLSGEGGSSDFWTGVGTTHGYQFNPHLFIGAGISFIWMLSDSDHQSGKQSLKYLPLYADVRTDLRFGRFTPFADLRLGCNLIRHGTFSGALTVGYRFSWGKRVGLNLALGVNLRGYRQEESASGWNPEEGMWTRPTGGYRTCFDAKPLVRLGVDF